MDFEQIEDKIIDALKTSITYARTILTYAGELDGSVEELAIAYPAIFTMFAGSQYGLVDGNDYNEVDIFSVIVASKNLRGNEAMRKDASIGCYKMIKDVLACIAGQNFNLDIERMKPLETRLLYVSKTITYYGIEFQTNFDKIY